MHLKVFRCVQYKGLNVNSERGSMFRPCLLKMGIFMFIWQKNASVFTQFEKNLYLAVYITFLDV